MHDSENLSFFLHFIMFKLDSRNLEWKEGLSQSKALRAIMEIFFFFFFLRECSLC